MYILVCILVYILVHTNIVSTYLCNKIYTSIYNQNVLKQPTERQRFLKTRNVC